MGLNLVLEKCDVAREDYGFYNVMAARDTSGETCWRCLYNLPADEPSTTGSGRVLTGAEGAGIGHRPNGDV